jgi:hypothetical protein
MAVIRDRLGREIRVGDWGGGIVSSADGGELSLEEVQGKVVGFDRDEGGWWVVLHTGRRGGDLRVRAGEIRCVASRAKRGSSPAGWRRSSR